MRVLLTIILTTMLACQDAGFKSNNGFAGNGEIINSGSGGAIGGDVTGGDSISDVETSGAISDEDKGVLGGHFDLDTSTELYALNEGSTFGHVHEYDDKFDVKGADFFNIKTDRLLNIQSTVPPEQRFRILVQNANLSPAGILSINGANMDVVTFSQSLNAAEVYSLNGVDGTLKLDSLSLNLSEDAFTQQRILPTATSCVKKNVPGKGGEYRNGALLVQVVDAENYTIDANTGILTSGLIWEASLFWHKDNNCY